MEQILYKRPIDRIELLCDAACNEYSCASSLCSLLDCYLGSDNYRSMQAMKDYKVGALKEHDGAKLWRLDRMGNPLNGQVLMFDEAGRPKEYLPITRTLYRYYACAYDLRLAFFGGHLLQDKSKPVALVQDEITALVASQVEPRFTWLAVGYGVNLQSDLLATLNGFDVVLYPDSMAVDFWEDTAKGFANVVCSKSFIEQDINEYLKKLEKERRLTG